MDKSMIIGIIAACVLLYAYISFFFSIYIDDAEEYQSLGKYKPLLAALWPIVFVQLLVRLGKYVYNGINEIVWFFKDDRKAS